MSTNKKNTVKAKEMDADVLYQKLGERWFAFSLIGDEVFMSPIPEETINEIKAGSPNRDPMPNEAAS